MARRWIRPGAYTHGPRTSNDTAQTENAVYNRPEADGDAVALRLICNGIADTADLWLVRFIVAPEMIVESDLSAASPEPDDDLVWADFIFSNSMFVYDIRSRRSLPGGYKIWTLSYKLSGAVASNLAWSPQILIGEP